MTKIVVYDVPRDWTVPTDLKPDTFYGLDQYELQSVKENEYLCVRWISDSAYRLGSSRLETLWNLKKPISVSNVILAESPNEPSIVKRLKRQFNIKNILFSASSIIGAVTVIKGFLFAIQGNVELGIEARDFNNRDPIKIVAGNTKSLDFEIRRSASSEQTPTKLIYTGVLDENGEVSCDKSKVDSSVDSALIVSMTKQFPININAGDSESVSVFIDTNPDDSRNIDFQLGACFESCWLCNTGVAISEKTTVEIWPAKLEPLSKKIDMSQCINEGICSQILSFRTGNPAYFGYFFRAILKSNDVELVSLRELRNPPREVNLAMIDSYRRSTVTTYIGDLNITNTGAFDQFDVEVKYRILNQKLSTDDLMKSINSAEFKTVKNSFSNGSTR